MRIVLLPTTVLAAFVAAGLPPAALAAPPAPAQPERFGLNTSLDRSSTRGFYRVRVTPLQKPVDLHRIQDWSLMIEHDGAPIEGAVIRVSGGMPRISTATPGPRRPKPRLLAAAISSATWSFRCGVGGS